MHDNIDMYGPCPCGSGRKYKFCCHKREQTGKSATGLPLLVYPVERSWQEQYATGLVIPRLDEAIALNQKGLQAIAHGTFGSDELRKDALHELFERGEIKYGLSLLIGTLKPPAYSFAFDKVSDKATKWRLSPVLTGDRRSPVAQLV